jgi:hypothetical protein
MTTSGIRLLAAALLLATASISAQAQDWFQFEAGIGASHISDMGDGTWIQEGAPNNREKQNTPALMAGFTGSIYKHESFDLRWHADYVYIGTYTASVDGVPDDNYNPRTHQVHNLSPGTRYSPFNGMGHTQGIPVTLDLGYTWHGFRFAVEGGMWAYRQTWHESLYDLGNQWVHFQHDPKTQFGYVAGARIERDNFSLSYRYYQIKADWSKGTPGLATGAHVLMATYRF